MNTMTGDIRKQAISMPARMRALPASTGEVCAVVAGVTRVANHYGTAPGISAWSPPD